MALITEPLLPGEYIWGKGKALVFTTWKGRNIVSRIRTPHDPKTPLQIAIRALTALLSRKWQTLSYYEKYTWNYYGDLLGCPGCLVFIKNNIARLQSGLCPSIDYEPEPESDPISISSHTFYGGNRFTTLILTAANNYDLWGFIIYRDTAEISTPNWSQIIAFIPYSTSLTISYTDSPLFPDTYHYRARTFNKDAVFGPLTNDETVPVS